MAAQGRKNVHGKAGVRFKAAYTASKRKSMLRNVVTELIVHERVTVTAGVVKDLKRETEHLITLAKKGDLHSRRLASSYVRNYLVDEEKSVSALDKLFSELAKRYTSRKGGYTRALKVINRKGDNAPMAIVELIK
ncbi:MAG: 50S ribosomal protein L17 [Bacilli bacterium]|jgi:large subunit ribosomal protein L17